MNKIEEATRGTFENKAENKKIKHKIPKALKKLYRKKSKVNTFTGNDVVYLYSK